MRRGIGLPQPLDQKPTAKIRSAGACARAGERALTGGPGASATEGGRTDRAGPAPEDLGADRRARAHGARSGTRGVRPQCHLGFLS